MKKIMMVGKMGCGKTTLSQRLCGDPIAYKKTQSVQLAGNDIVDTPGEYMEQKVFYRALIVSAVQVEEILILQACTDEQCSFSPGMGSMFGKPLVGVVTKTDLAGSEEEIERTEELLRLAGAEKIFRIGAEDEIGLKALRAYLS